MSNIIIVGEEIMELKINLDQIASKKLKQFAQENNTNPNQYALELILEHIDDVKDLRLGKEAYQRHLESGDALINLSDI